MKKILKNLDVGIASILLAAVIILTIINVFFRFFFPKVSFGWASESITMLYVWCIFIGAAAVYRKRGHISIVALVEALPETLRKTIGLLTDIMLMIMFLAAAWTALDYTLNGSYKVFGVLRISVAYEYAAMPIGFFLMAIYTIPHIVEDIKNWKGGNEVNES